MISNVVSIPLDDGVTFQIVDISEILEEIEYPGVRVHLESRLSEIVTPLKIDISTGHVITPRAIRYAYKLMFENRSIGILAYNIETVLAEKLKTILTRNIANTRMRDFYDIHVLITTYEEGVDSQILHDALIATAEKSGTIQNLTHTQTILDAVEKNEDVQKLWLMYQKKFPYAVNIEWEEVIHSIRSVFAMAVS